MYQITVNPTIPCIITQEVQLNTDKLYMFTAGITTKVGSAPPHKKKKKKKKKKKQKKHRKLGVNCGQ